MTPKLLAYLPLLFVVICLPMALRLVPPNGIYGIRTPETLSNAVIWYEVNSRAGGAGVIAGLAATVFNVIAVLNLTMTDSRKLTVEVVTTLGTALVMAAAGLIRN